MKKKIVLSLMAVLLVLLSYGFGYWGGFSHAGKSVRIRVAKDTSDSQQSSGKAMYEPYFTRQNPIPERLK